MKDIKLIELFAGIGAQASALDRLGIEYESHFVCEIDESALNSYNAIHDSAWKATDICKLHAKDLNICDDGSLYILTYSFPCQDLSIAGKQKGMAKGSGTRSGLLWEVDRLLSECEIKPKVLLMENVPQVHGKANIDDFNLWIARLEELGYYSEYADLNAKDFGIPQDRRRTFMVSMLGCKPNVLNKLKTTELNKVIGNFLDLEIGSEFVLEKDKIEKIKKWKSQQKPLDRILSFDSVCPTLTARGAGENHSGMVLINPRRYMGNHKYIEDEYVRFITPRECYRLMGFTDKEYEKAASVSNKHQLYRQAGNSICVDVLVAIFREILEVYGNETCEVC